VSASGLSYELAPLKVGWIEMYLDFPTSGQLTQRINYNRVYLDPLGFYLLSDNLPRDRQSQVNPLVSQLFQSLFLQLRQLGRRLGQSLLRLGKLGSLSYYLLLALSYPGVEPLLQLSLDLFAKLS